MLKRKIADDILEYFNQDPQKILIIHGARQIGKIFIIRHLGSNHFKNFIEINLKEDFDSNRYFENIRTLEDFHIRLSLIAGEKLGKREDTLIFLDEIQVYPHIISMLKPLNQENKYRYIVSGSMLGIALKSTFIPMGSITKKKMYPLDFEEFLWANKVGDLLISHLKDCFFNLKPISDDIHNRMLDLFKKYLITGGLPDAVNDFIITKNIFNMSKTQDDLYEEYRIDASRYDDENNLKIKRIYDLLPSYMANKVKRIKAIDIENIKDVRFNRYENEFDYLISSGVALGVKAVSNPKFPLVQTESKKLIKLYFNDVGLLSNRLYRNQKQDVLLGNKDINLGSIYETVVATELISHDHELFYFDSKKVGEVDFLINDYENLSVIPIEVKSGKDIYSYRAIPKLVAKNGNYKLHKGIILSNKNITKKDGDLYFYPIYQVMFI